MKITEKAKRLAAGDREEKSARARVKQLEAIVEKQQERIDRLSRAKYKLPRAPAKLKGRANCRIIIPDTHGCYADDKALGAFLADLEAMKGRVKEIVMLGDHLDCGSFLAGKHTMGYVAEAAYSVEDDIAATNVLLDRIQSICPTAPIHYLEGNHERRIDRWCVTQATGRQADAAYLLRLHSPHSVLHIEKRGISYYRQGEFYHGVAIPATIKLGRCHFTHGSHVGQHATAAMLRDFGNNVVFGHIHQIDSTAGRTVKEGAIGAWSCGCLCRLQPLWMHTQITRWSHGYGLQLVRDDGDFLHINVPVIDGKSYLMHLTGGK